MDRGAWWATKSLGLQRVRHDCVTEHTLKKNLLEGNLFNAQQNFKSLDPYTSVEYLKTGRAITIHWAKENKTTSKWERLEQSCDKTQPWNSDPKSGEKFKTQTSS